MEGYTIRQQPLAALRGGSRLLRLASDERLIELTRGGQQAAFEALVARYHARLLAFCRHMLHSREDAEDVLQEVFAAAFNAIMADSREINARPWLYRIARNRSLNHLRRNTAIGMDSMDTHFADAGQSTSEKAHKREEFRLLLEDIEHLPETQRSALVLREMDALSYEQIAEAMDTTVPGVKSLLVRARIGLAEAAEARRLTCDEVRLELGAAAEGIASLSAPVRRHVKTCDRCRAFRTQLRTNNRALAAIFPLGPLVLLKKTILFKLGLAKVFGAGGASATGAGASAGASATATAAAGSGGLLGGTAAVATGGAGIGSVAAGAVVVKAVAVAATVAIVAVGATTIHLHSGRTHPGTPVNVAAVAGAAAAKRPVALPPVLAAVRAPRQSVIAHHRFVAVLAPVLYPTAATLAPASPSTTTTTVAATPAASPTVAPTPSTPAPTPTTQEISTTTVFPASTGGTGSTSAQGTPVALGSTGASGSASVGATGASGASATATGSTGATGSVGAVQPSFSQEQTGPTGSTGAGS